MVDRWQLTRIQQFHNKLVLLGIRGLSKIDDRTYDLNLMCGYTKAVPRCYDSCVTYGHVHVELN